MTNDDILSRMRECLKDTWDADVDLSKDDMRELIHCLYRLGNIDTESSNMIDMLYFYVKGYEDALKDITEKGE